MKLSKNMQWAEPYIEFVRHQVNLDKVLEVKGYEVPKGRKCQVLGRCHPKGRKYTITMMLAEQGTPVTMNNALETLAHELAHVKEWEHSPKHLELTANILADFARVAEVEEVKDLSRNLKRKRA